MQQPSATPAFSFRRVTVNDLKHVPSPVKVPALAAPTDSKVSQTVVKVKGDIMYIYTKVGDFYLQIKLLIKEGLVAARDRGIKELNVMKIAIEGFKSKVHDGAILVRANVMAAGTQIKTSVLNIGTGITSNAVVGRDLVQMKLLDAYQKISSVLEKMPIPVNIHKAYFYIQSKGRTFLVFVKDGSMYMYGNFASAIVRVKVKGVESFEAAKKKAVATIARVALVMDSYVAEAKTGLGSMRCKVHDALVSIETNVGRAQTLTKSKAAEVYSRMKKIVGELTVTKRLSQDCRFIQDKVNDIAIYVKDGYVHMSSRVGDNFCYMKAKMSEAKGQVFLKIVEKYTTTRDVILELIKKAQAAVKDAAGIAQNRMSGLAVQTKAAYAERPIAGGAATGAMFLGFAGGATGGAAGFCTGAACGMPLAFFTFGLSIPVGAVIGGGAGVAAGAAVGGIPGAAGGAVAGYGYEHRAQIRSGVGGAIAKASTLGDDLKKRLPRISSSTGGTSMETRTA